MRRKPKICVQHRAHHLHRVAAEREVVRDEQRDETRQARHRAAESNFVDAFQNQSQHTRAPTNEDGRRIKIRHRRSAFQRHAKNQSSCMNDKRQTDQIKRRASQRFGDVRPRTKREQRTTRQHKREDVDDRRVQEHFHAIEIKLRSPLARFLCEIFFQPILVSRHSTVELRLVVREIGVGDAGIKSHRWRNLRVSNRAQQTRARV